jgi:hypothetical protein
VGVSPRPYSLHSPLTLRLTRFATLLLTERASRQSRSSTHGRSNVLPCSAEISNAVLPHVMSARLQLHYCQRLRCGSTKNRPRRAATFWTVGTIASRGSPKSATSSAHGSRFVCRDAATVSGFGCLDKAMSNGKLNKGLHGVAALAGVVTGLGNRGSRTFHSLRHTCARTA